MDKAVPNEYSLEPFGSGSVHADAVQAELAKNAHEVLTGIEHGRGRVRDVFTVDGWELFGSSPLNALLIGPPALTHGFLDRVRAQLRAPIVRVHPHEDITLPPVGPVGTVILHDVGELTLADQRRLLQWLDNAPSRPRMISTASTPIIAKVREGTFLAALYYRLNFFYVDMVHV